MDWILCVMLVVPFAVLMSMAGLAAGEAMSEAIRQSPKRTLPQNWPYEHSPEPRIKAARVAKREDFVEGSEWWYGGSVIKVEKMTGRRLHYVRRDGQPDGVMLPREWARLVPA